MLLTIAKDVKIQVEFNPAAVAEYRLIGYEDRMLGAADFNNDAKDAGEIGSGHTVTALYEITPAGAMSFAIAKGPAAVAEDVAADPRVGRGTRESRRAGTAEVGARKDSHTSDGSDSEDSRTSDLSMPPDIDPLKYQTPGELLAAAGDGVIEAFTVKLRYKLPQEDTSRLLDLPVFDDGRSFGCASGDFRFASAVAGFGMLLRNSQNVGNWTFDAVLATARAAAGDDPTGRRGEFVELVRKAMRP